MALDAAFKLGLEDQTLTQSVLLLYLPCFFWPKGPANRSGPDGATGRKVYQGRHTQRLQCSSFLGSILQSLRRKQVITKRELHRSLSVQATLPPQLHDTGVRDPGQVGIKR